VALDTFAVLAAQVPNAAAVLDVLADAQQDRLYVQRFLRSGDDWQAAAPLAIVSVTEWLAQHMADVWATGPGLRVLGDRSAGLLVTEEALGEPRPESLLRLGLMRFRAGERDDWTTLEPLYARPSSAELKRPDDKATRP
jgi:tRNA A37 threonylcarbamoyladenosine modification protein TsaB